MTLEEKMALALENLAQSVRELKNATDALNACVKPKLELVKNNAETKAASDT